MIGKSLKRRFEYWVEKKTGMRVEIIFVALLLLALLVALAMGFRNAG